MFKCRGPVLATSENIRYPVESRSVFAEIKGERSFLANKKFVAAFDKNVRSGVRRIHTLGAFRLDLESGLEDFMSG